MTRSMVGTVSQRLHFFSPTLTGFLSRGNVPIMSAPGLDIATPRQQCPRLVFSLGPTARRKQSERDDIRSRRTRVSFNSPGYLTGKQPTPTIPRLIGGSGFPNGWKNIRIAGCGGKDPGRINGE